MKEYPHSTKVISIRIFLWLFTREVPLQCSQSVNVSACSRNITLQEFNCVHNCKRTWHAQSKILHIIFTSVYHFKSWNVISAFFVVLFLLAFVSCVAHMQKKKKKIHIPANKPWAIFLNLNCKMLNKPVSDWGVGDILFYFGPQQKDQNLLKWFFFLCWLYNV